MNNEQLHTKLISLTTLERKTLTEILELLRLNFKRKVFAKMGYSHLTKYMISELGYSESAAWRRWSALKITEELPQAKAMLESGRVNLSTLSKLESHMREEKTEVKVKALDLIQDQTIQETEKTLFDLTGRTTIKKEVVIRQSDSTQRLSITMSDETIEKLNRLKQLTQKQDTEAVLNLALDQAIQKIEQEKIKASKQKPAARAATGRLRKLIMKSANHQCQYPGCNEVRYLQVDHLKAYAKGGRTEKANLKVLCGVHNRLKGF
jgi:hypothetical protein